MEQPWRRWWWCRCWGVADGHILRCRGCLHWGVIVFDALELAFGGQHRGEIGYIIFQAFCVKRKQLLLKHNALKLCGNERKLYRKSLWIFHSVTSHCVPFYCLSTNKLFNSSVLVYWEPSMELLYTYISWRVVKAIALTKILDQLMLQVLTSNGWMDWQIS